MRLSQGLPNRSALLAIALGIGTSACKETITEPITVAAVVVNGGGGTLRLGQSVQLSTTLKSTEGWTLPNVGVSWASSDAAKANISFAGQVTAVSRGPVTLTATAGGVNGTAAVTVIGVQSIVLAPETLSVIVTQTRAMTATTVLDPGVTVTPTWRSLDTTIARVDTAGRVTARTTTGFARVEVTAEDKKDTAVVRVVPVPVVSVVVSPDTATRTVGQTLQLTATPKDSIGGTLAGRVVTWSSSDSARAAVSAAGLVTVKAAGTATITATIEGKTGRATLTLKVPVADVTVSQSCTGSGSFSGGTGRLYTGETCEYGALVRDGAGNTLTDRSVTWTSSDTTVAKIDGAPFEHPTTKLSTVKLLPRKGGSITLTAAVEGKSSSAALTVLVPVASITVTPATATLAIGATQQLTATLKDSVGGILTGRTVAWSSSDTTKATVSNTGLLTARATGSVTITVASEGKSATSVITVQATPIPQNRSIVYNNQANNVVRVTTTGTSSGSLAAGVHPIQVNDRLIFRGGFGDNKIYSSALSGSSKTVLINAFSFSPDLTAGGTRLTFFDGDCGGNAHTVAVANADGTNTQRLANICAITPPRWAPDNSAIAYQTEQGIEIYTLTTGVKRSVLSLSGNQEVSGWRWYGNVSWSADGSRLSFAARTSIANQYCLFTVSVNGTALEKLPATCTTDIGYHDWDWETGTLALEMSSGANSFLSMFTEAGAQIGAIASTTGATWPRWTRSAATVPIASVVVTPATSSIIVGATQQLTATLKDVAGNTLTGQTVTWTTSNADIATVSTTGLVSAQAPGNVTISASSEGLSGSATLSITTASGWITRNGRQFKFISTTPMSWSAARSAARSIGNSTDLASLSSPGDREFLRDYLRNVGVANGRVWIGLFQDLSGTTYSEPSGGWKWVSGQDFSGEGWSIGEPSNSWGGEHVGMIGVDRAADANNGYYNDLRDSDAGDNRGYVVESVESLLTSIEFSPQNGPLAAGNQSCAIDIQERAYCWGLNTEGQVGDGSTTSRLIPVPVAGSLRFRSIAVAQRFTCGITVDSLPYCWGANSEGQLGTGSNSSSSVPVAVSGGHRFVSIVGTGRQMCALTADGTGYCWGHNPHGEVGDGTTTRRSVPTAILTNDKFKSLHAADFVTCGLTRAGRVLCWGEGQEGRTGTNSSAILTTPTLVSGNRTYEALNTSGQSSCARLLTGGIDCWGMNRSGEFSGSLANVLVPTATTFSGVKFRSISIGIGFGCGLVESGIPYCWGTRPLSLGTGATSSTFSQPAPVSLPEVATRIVAGSESVCAITLSGRLFCWGENTYGQLGDGTSTSKSTPREIGIGVVFKQ